MHYGDHSCPDPHKAPLYRANSETPPYFNYYIVRDIAISALWGSYWAIAYSNIYGSY